ncbi:MAG: nucleotidyltransferase substrate binding protein [Gammaproteobacteria bacterium]|nr:nucleotidyltransferase substrate binding protein [Gammaproteobacteria bacterium]
MDLDRFEERRGEFFKAAYRLREACEQPDSSFMRDSVIQRFEFTWELAWKLMRLWLEHLGVSANNPRDVFKEALQAGLLTDGNAWSELQKMRNLTTHTYDESLAATVYHYIRGEGLGLIESLVEKVKTWDPAS